jgi:hypothetical protein
MSAKPDAAAKVRPDADVVAQRLGDEIVMVHLRTNQIFVLNRTGARFWELVSDGSDLDEAKEKMLAEFDVDEGALTAEIDAFVEALAKEQLIIVDERS